MHVNLPIVICFAGGAGGNFVNSALRSALFDHKSKLSDSGNAHYNRQSGVHFNPSDSIEGIQGELDVIKQLSLADNNAIINGHYKNLVALQSVHPQLWFIKITHNTESEEQCNLLYQLSHNKGGELPCNNVNNYYQEEFLRWMPAYQKPYWPESFEDMANELKNPNSKVSEFVRNNSLYTSKTWYWVENVNTRKRTIELDLRDIFLEKISTKLNNWFDKDICDKLDRKQEEYQTLNHSLFPQIKEVLQ